MGKELEQFANDCAKLCPAIEPDIVKAAIKAGARIQKQLEQCMYEYIQKEVKDFISEGKIRKSSYNKEEILIKDWIKEKFTGDTGYNNTEKVIKSLAKDFGKELKERYDLLFASQLVAKMSETGLLKEDVAKLLLPKQE